MSRYTRALRKAAKVAAQAPVPSDGPQNPELNSVSAGSLTPREIVPATGFPINSPESSPHEPPTAETGTTSVPGLGSPITERDTTGYRSGLNLCGTASTIPGRDWVPDSRPGALRQPFNDGWLWRDRIRAGDLSVIVANHGVGASTVACDWIARVTTGRAFPGCSPGDALPPSDVLLLNAVEDFSRTVIRRIVQQGGNPQRVLLATNPLLEWGEGNRDFPPDPNPFLVPVESRVRLQTTAAMEKLGRFLRQRPSIRLVVIDHLKQHFRCDSERAFEGLMHDLVSLARELDIAFVLIQPPDAFRKAEGTAQYLKSDSLRQVARSIWRLATPVRRSYGERVLQCLKLSHPVEDQARQNWRIDRQPSGRLEWKPGTGMELYAPLDEIRQAALNNAHHYLIHRLNVNDGTMDIEDLLADGRRCGIDPKHLRDAVIQNALEALYQDHHDGTRTIVGWPDAIARLNAQWIRRAEWQRLQQESQRTSLLVPGEVRPYDAGPVEMSVTPSSQSAAIPDNRPGEGTLAMSPSLASAAEGSAAEEISTGTSASAEAGADCRLIKPNMGDEGLLQSTGPARQGATPNLAKLLALLEVVAGSSPAAEGLSQAG